MATQKPVKTFRSRGIQASIWKNEKLRDGEAVVDYSISIRKQYRKDGEYLKTDCFFPDDLPRLQLVARKAYEYISLKESDSEDADS